MSSSTSSVAPTPSINPIRVTGRVKSYNLGRRYGFVEPDDASLGDLLLHRNCLRPFGLEFASEGAHIVCEAQQGPKGYLVTKILSYTSIGASPQSSVVFEAVVKWFDAGLGYGFVTREPGTSDIFVFAKTLRLCGIGNLTEGQRVKGRSEHGPKGEFATQIELL